MTIYKSNPHAKIAEIENKFEKKFYVLYGGLTRGRKDKKREGPFPTPPTGDVFCQFTDNRRQLQSRVLVDDRILREFEFLFEINIIHLEIVIDRTSHDQTTQFLNNMSHRPGGDLVLLHVRRFPV